MRELEQPIGRVWRRLRFQRFLAASVWSSGGALLIVALVLGVVRGLDRHLPGPAWLPFAVAGSLALAVAIVVAVVSGPTRVHAAQALDREFHLHERLSTALTLPDDLRETPAGRALIADAVKRAAALEIGTAFRPSIPRGAWVPIVPLSIALGILFAPDWTRNQATARPASRRDAQVIARQTQVLGKKIASQRKEMEKNQFAEADKLLAEIEKAADNLAKAPPTQKDKALVELNKLSDALKEREKQLGSSEQMRRQLQQLKEMAGAGPADDFARNLARGEFPKAADELKKLQEKLLSGKMTEGEKNALKEQIGEMSRSSKSSPISISARQQLQEAMKNGGLSKEQFEREMAKLDEQARSLQKLQKMAQQLAQAQEQLGQGNMQESRRSARHRASSSSRKCRDSSKSWSRSKRALAEIQDAKNGMSGDAMNQLGESLGQFGGSMDRRERPERHGPRARTRRPPRSPRRHLALQHEGRPADQEGQGHRRRDLTLQSTRQGAERDRDPGRHRGCRGTFRRGPDQPEDPPQRREAYPGIFRSDQQRSVAWLDLQAIRVQPAAASGCR